jgi:cellulose synthase/poly-beta-1,6-N-acetylglucosamine synthase-like glycosyltransferase
MAKANARCMIRRVRRRPQKLTGYQRGVRVFLERFLQVLYVLSTVGLAIVGFNTLVLAALYWRHRQEDPAPPAAPPPGDWPSVVVQLPIFNERHVVERLIEAVAALDYPRDRLHVQVLDDSTDETVHLVARAVEAAKARGLHIEQVLREKRVGYKAGALEYGMQHSDADFIAVFDADFQPHPDFLRRTVPHFLSDARLGMVQARWAHLNDSYNLLTRAQALALDAHFVVEQTARHRSGLLMNFSGTAGVWRRACLEDAGGWQHDTLSEDIDASYRAQMRGWRFLYLPDVGVPAEIPPLMMGFKRQQARWATGTIQCLKKLGGQVLTSPSLSLAQKAEAMVHLGGYLLHPFMVLLLLTTLPLLLMGGISGLPLAGLGLAMLGSPVQAALSQTRLYDDWKRRLLVFPVFMVLGVGIAVSNSLAVWRALVGGQQAFQRTPKFQVGGQTESWLGSNYTLPVDGTTWAELLLAVYAAVSGVLAVTRLPALAPFMLLYAVGFGYVAGLSLYQAQTARHIQEHRAIKDVRGGSAAI